MNSLEDIDCKLGALQIVIQDNPGRLEELESMRDSLIKKYHNQLYGYYEAKKSYCLCSWKKGKMIINPKCPQHHE